MIVKLKTLFGLFPALIEDIGPITAPVCDDGGHLAADEGFMIKFAITQDYVPKVKQWADAEARVGHVETRDENKLQLLRKFSTISEFGKHSV